MIDIAAFIAEIKKQHQTGMATEHSYRPALYNLLNSLGSGLNVVNEPKRAEFGAPDFVVEEKGVAIGHIEAKDLDISLQGMTGTNKEQQNRYKKALPNLIYTNCLDWEFYRDGKLVNSITIAEMTNEIRPISEKYKELISCLKDFVSQTPQTISSPKELAERMAGKAQLIKDIMRNTLNDDDRESDLILQYEAFKENLITGITKDDFADIYAETISYGMFAARLHDEAPKDFTRQKAAELLPKSNPFLRKLFGFIAGPDLDDRIKWIVDDLAHVFRACDFTALMRGFGRFSGREDPFLHFYETFLAAYNPSKRRARGVWYTPEPVVNFIVRAVDDVLKTEFNLTQGLADTSKLTIDWDTGQQLRTKNGNFRKDGKKGIVKKEVHRIQILDPATGTGTFPC